MDWLRMSWNDVTPTTIKHCFQHVGFKDFPATEETSAADTSICSSAEEAGLVSDGLSFEDFVALDDVANGLEIDDILNSLHALSDDENDDNEYSLNIHAPSFDTAISCLDTVMKFFRTLPCSEKQIQSVGELQNFLAESLNRLQAIKDIVNFETICNIIQSNKVLK